jgi:hypothetical protein
MTIVALDNGQVIHADGITTHLWVGNIRITTSKPIPKPHNDAQGVKGNANPKDDVWWLIPMKHVIYMGYYKDDYE